MLDERLLLVGKVGCFLCLVGSTVIVLNAPEEEDVTSVDQLTEKIETNIGMVSAHEFLLRVNSFGC